MPNLEFSVTCIVATFIIGIISDGLYITNFGVYDWYQKGKTPSYNVFNFTSVHILEVIVLSICIYVHR